MASAPAPWDMLQQLRRRLQRLIWWSGLAQLVSALFGGIIFAGWLDWFWQLEDTGLRILLAVSVWGLVTVIFWRRLLRPLRYDLNDVFLAAQVDRYYPGFGSRLTSAAEFRRQALDPRNGSPELQQLVIQQAANDLQHLEPDRLLEPRKLSPHIVGALSVCLLTFGLLYAYPLEASTALRRMAWPLGQTPWPRTVVLQLRTVDGQPLEWNPRDSIQKVRGETLELTVENVRGALPADLRLQVREPGQEIPEEIPISLALPPSTAKQESSSSKQLRGKISLPALRDHVEFRAVGGDDHHLPWYQLSAMDPPKLVASTIEVTPPSYLGLPPTTLPAGTTQIRGYLGSRVEIHAAADRAIDRVELRMGDAAPVKLPVLADQKSWTAELKIERPGLTHFSFVLRDSAGFAQPQPLQFELRGEIDTIPTVTLQEPMSDQWVTPDAVLSLRATAQDDLGLTGWQRAWQRGDLPVVTDPLDDLPQQPQQAEWSGQWALSDLKLIPGERIILRMEARDACDVGEPHIGRSAPRTLLVVSADEKRRELTDRIAELASELREGLLLQERLNLQNLELQTQLQQVGELQPADRDQLNRLQWDQRQLAAQLSDELRGLSRRAAQLQGEFPSNQLQDPAAEPQLEDLSDELRQLAASTFPAIDRELTRAIKASEPARETPMPNADNQHQDQPNTDTSPTPAPNSPEAMAVQTALRQAQQLQADALSRLQERHSVLARWQQDRNLGDDLNRLQEGQQQLNRDTAELGAQTLSRALAELSPQQRADLNKLGERQRQLGQRVEQLQREFQELAERLEDRDAVRAAEVTEFAEQLEQSHLAMRLRQAGDDLAGNRLGSAGEVQQQAQQTLQELSQRWSQERPDDLEQMKKRTDDVEQMTKSLRDDVEEMRKRTDPASAPPPSAEQQAETLQRAQELRRRAQKLERELQRLKLKRGEQQAQRAARSLQSAQESLAADDQEAATAELAEAAEALEELQAEVDQAQQEIAESLAQEAFEKIHDRLTAMKARQDAAVADLQRLDEEQRSSGRLTRGQLRTLQDLAAVERELQAEATELSEQVAEAIVAQSALTGVARSLERAASRLEQRHLDGVSLLLTQDAARRLQRIIAAWTRKDAPPGTADKAPASTDPENEPPQSPNAGPPGDAISWQTQLALLRELQADCLERTQTLQRLRAPGAAVTPELQPLFEDVAAEQGELVRLARQMVVLLKESAAAKSPGTTAPMSDSSPDATSAQEPQP